MTFIQPSPRLSLARLLCLIRFSLVKAAERLGTRLAFIKAVVVIITNNINIVY